MSVRIFISYAHKDRAWCELLLDHLGWLRHSGQLAVFDDQQIKPGERWDDRIRSELADASIVVPMISPSFIGSHYCAVDELLEALQGGKRLVPVLVEHVDLKALPLTAFQCLPKDEKQDLRPLTAWPNPHHPLAAIAAAIREAVVEADKPVVAATAATAERAISARLQAVPASGRVLLALWLIGATMAALVAVSAIRLLESGNTNVSATGGIAAGQDAIGNKVITNGFRP